MSLTPTQIAEASAPLDYIARHVEMVRAAINDPDADPDDVTGVATVMMRANLDKAANGVCMALIRNSPVMAKYKH